MIIDVAELQEACASETPPIVLDARQGLDGSESSLELWLEGRIPGAAHLDMATVLTGPQRADGIGGRRPMPTPAALIDGLNRAGVRAGARVVAYDARMEGVAARLWWAARELGIVVEVLEGGLAAWKSAGGAVEAGGSSLPPAAGDLQCPDGIDPHAPIGTDGRGTVTAQQLLERPSSALLLDVRAAARYRGDEDERGARDDAGGHIPGAVNVPTSGEDGQQTPPEVIAELVGHEGEVITSCGSGISACLMLLRLAEAGRPDAKLYPGSWSEWRALGLPHATGDEPG